MLDGLRHVLLLEIAEAIQKHVIEVNLSLVDIELVLEAHRALRAIASEGSNGGGHKINIPPGAPPKGP